MPAACAFGDNGRVNTENENGALLGSADPDLPAQLRAATALLEAVVADMSLLDALPKGERHRLQQAIANIYHPDPVLRRQRLKAAERERNAAQVRQEEAVLDSTGIRALRRRPVFTTPNVFPPRDFQPGDLPVDADDDGRAPRERLEPRHHVALVARKAHTVFHSEFVHPGAQRFALRTVANDDEHRALGQRIQQRAVPLPAAQRGDDANQRFLNRQT